MLTPNILTRSIGKGNATVWRKLIEMGKRYLSYGWIPHKLTEANKQHRLEVCRELLIMHANNYFLQRCITMDESWIYWDNDGAFGNRSWRGAGDQPQSSVM